MEKRAAKKDAFLWGGLRIGVWSIASLLVLLWLDALLLWKEVLPAEEMWPAILLTAFLSGMAGALLGRGEGLLSLPPALGTVLLLLLLLLAARKDMAMQLGSVLPVTAALGAGMITMKITKIYNMHKKKGKGQKRYHK